MYHHNIDCCCGSEPFDTSLGKPVVPGALFLGTAVAALITLAACAIWRAL
jgi:hypothetical protein